MENWENILPSRVEQIMHLPKWIFSISFILGTILFAINFLEGNRNSYLTIIGFFYVSITLFINIITVGVFAICAYVFPDYQNEIMSKTAILFINIPISILYCYLVFSSN